MKAYATRAFIVVAMSLFLVVWASRLPACTDATVHTTLHSTLPQFRAFTSMT
jgi:hypothetical protein